MGTSISRVDLAWDDADGQVSRVVLEQSEGYLRSYEAKPSLIEEHANIERSITQGGYGRRQLYELVQNGADELQHEPGGRIHVVLSQDVLYCANLGRPITPEGVETILASHMSRKRGTEIGRFGLGFKSVLTVSSRPQFFSRTGSFGWDAASAEERIRERVPGDGPTPVLRLAGLLDPLAEGAGDPILAELMSWATTVVKLPLREDQADRLADDLNDFPARFAIFSPHVGNIILEDRRRPTEPLRREISVQKKRNKRILVTVEGGNTDTSEWMVFQTVHTPTEHAKQDASEYHNRDKIPIAWAVPVSGQQGLGEFWAFFPTMWATTLRGVLNAPWKTNEDRQNLIKGNRFNDELMGVAADLIVTSLPRLATASDPGRPLSLITARGREARNWADEMLTDLVYENAAQKPSIPDQSGALRRPITLNLHPEKLRKEWLEMWSSYPGRPMSWCHPSVEDPTRRSRVETIFDRAGRRSADVCTWLEALVSDGTADASVAALSIVADMVRQRHHLAADARQAKVLRTDRGLMVAPLADTVFRRTPLDTSDDLRFVDPELDQDDTAGDALTILGIREANAVGRFAAIVRPGFLGYRPAQWEQFWRLARAAGPEPAIEILKEQKVEVRDLCVRTGAGAFRPLRHCLLPGRVIPHGTQDDAQFVVDLSFHHADIGMLRTFGLADVPESDVDPTSEAWYHRYRKYALDIYYHTIPANERRPQEGNIIIAGASPVGPLGLLSELSPGARARFLEAIPTVGLKSLWHVWARTRRDDVPVAIDSPLAWMANEHGFLRTSLGLRPVRECVGPTLSNYSSFLPVAHVDSGLATVLSLPEQLSRISRRVWAAYFEKARSSEDHEFVGGIYAVAAEADVPAPEQLRCRVGKEWLERSATEVAVAADEAQYGRLTAHDVPAILAPDLDAARRLVGDWSMRSFAQALVTELRAMSLGPPTPLEDTFPQLRLLPGRPLRALSLVRCSRLDELIRTPSGQIAQPLNIGRDEQSVYWREIEDDFALLQELSALMHLELTPERCRQVLRHREEIRKNQRIVEVRRQKDDVDRLTRMLPATTLREKLPQGLVEYVEKAEGKADDRTIAELTISVYGTAVLRKYRPELEKVGFVLPTQMAGGHRARSFVADLGFSTEFAGYSTPALEPMLTVEGPVDFPPLHDYQERMVGRMTDVLRSSPPQRGMLSLPTGAGKTRVAVEAAIRLLTGLPEERASVPVLWIAQTEELCEQAVQSWQFVWRAIGPQRRRLTISRLWTGHEADPVSAGFHLVVATDAKLEKIVSEPEYEWLRLAQAVIVDEAHTSLSPRYTKVLSALGLTARRTRCPLIGLSATPFRGVDEDETSRLVARYGGIRLDHDRHGREILGENPYPPLQELGVLARVNHEELAGANIELDADERANLVRLRRLPPTAEDRLGRNHDRNEILLRKIRSLPEDWPILLFATSVDHAHMIAALLTRKGVPAAAISGDTDIGVRRRVIEQFRDQRIRVLANYGVLSQGFDAPATRAVIVARPTYSPNVYQQMIGRGLRGPKNGGKEECLIINVADNIAQYGEELAFRKFEHLWKRR